MESLSCPLLMELSTELEHLTLSWQLVDMEEPIKLVPLLIPALGMVEEWLPELDFHCPIWSLCNSILLAFMELDA